MKKEICAIAVLVLILTASLINIRCVCRITDELVALSEASAQAGQNGSWEEAALYAKKAVDRWSSSDGYTHIVLRHTEIDAVSDSLFEMLEHAYAGENADELLAASRKAVYHLESISGMEKIRPGSIF